MGGDTIACDVPEEQGATTSNTIDLVRGLASVKVEAKEIRMP